MGFKKLFGKKVEVVNIGLDIFKDDLEKQGQKVTNVEWTPPANLDKNILQILQDNRAKIETANEKALEIILNGKPFLIGLDIARNVIPGMKENLLLHSGPPLTWDRMSGPMKGAMIGAMIYEGKAKDFAEAEKLGDTYTDFSIPNEVIERIRAAGDQEAQKKEGLTICAEIITKIKDMPGLRGVHILSGGNETIVPELIAAAGL